MAIRLIFESGAIYCIAVIFLLITSLVNGAAKITSAAETSHVIGLGFVQPLLNIIPTFTLVYVGRIAADTPEDRNFSASSTRIPRRLVGRQTFGPAEVMKIGPHGEEKESGEVATLSSLRSSLPAWARDRRLSRHLTSGVLPLLLLCTLLSYLLTPSPALYDPRRSAQHTPPPQPPAGRITTSIVVPTFHERANLAPLVQATYSSLPPAIAERTEIVFVDDDSQDGTEEEVERLREEGYERVELLTRPREGGERGLSSAVLRGFERARGARLVVMDADLQHPPSAIPALLAALGPEGDDDDEGAAPMALGTRYGRGVSMDANWPLYRRVISWGARILARPLTTASDPMTGFFAVRKDAFLAARPLSPQGFKIALELLLAIPAASRPPEVPYSFGVRTAGSSKLGAKVILKYVLQLLWLYRRRLGVFWHLVVGAGLAGAVWTGREVREKGWRAVWRRFRGRSTGKGPLLPVARRRGRLE
ncbi:nucleotide-diphospho-sugar transferase [Mycena maculata]|uniref:Dolichol-phosphate mannosyltransferase subunit 1 n=1 Tax=Mycena maculata TaxID=230809 RepID=A0AAD7I238_9AGAR|nr:nucleotide-diphospho-sugar transferase [Mycena maculata]